MKEAYLYERVKDETVRCLLCSHRCLIRSGDRGMCNVRENRAATLFTLVYDKIIARNADPIEKKPIYHFLPGTRSYSIATPGCNFKCTFCQNADISQMPSDLKQILGEPIPPEQIVQDALATGCATISYTYTEPTVYFELALDTAVLATSKGLKNVFVTNGYMTRECLERIHPHLHAANVDLKAFRDEFYKKQCRAKLGPVLESIQTMKEMGIWVEVTTLLIPGLNDSEEELKEIADFLVGIDPAIPWHISRFHPTYRLTSSPPTPATMVRKARQIGYDRGLQYVYTGNLPGDEGENTFCHKCGELLIERFGFYVRQSMIREGRCQHCSAQVPGVWGID